ncbi:MAG: DoxX family protein [Acidobacteriota bacterium]
MQKESAPVGKKSLWIGYALSGLSILFLLVDAGMKIAQASASVQGTVDLGYPESTVVPIGLALLVSVLLYAVPQTSFWGALLLTGYLGGAVATHVRVGAPLLAFFPVFVAVMIWGGLACRDRRLRELISIH